MSENDIRKLIKSMIQLEDDTEITEPESTETENTQSTSGTEIPQPRSGRKSLLPTDYNTNISGPDVRKSRKSTRFNTVTESTDPENAQSTSSPQSRRKSFVEKMPGFNSNRFDKPRKSTIRFDDNYKKTEPESTETASMEPENTLSRSSSKSVFETDIEKPRKLMMRQFDDTPAMESENSKSALPQSTRKSVFQTNIGKQRMMRRFDDTPAMESEHAGSAWPQSRRKSTFEKDIKEPRKSTRLYDDDDSEIAEPELGQSFRFSTTEINIPSDDEEKEEEVDRNSFIVILKYIRLYWKSLFLVIWPFISCIVFLIDHDRKIRCLYVTVLMMGYYVTECLPLFITGLIPIALIPLMAINTTGDVCANYINNTNFLLLSGLLISHAINHSGLQSRMAYRAMLLIGCSPRRLLCGLTMTSVFLSMWLVNSATTAMMCPVIHAILAEYEKYGIGPVYHPKNPEKDSVFDRPRPTNVTKAFFLTVAFASSVGGTATLVGTGTNITFKILFESSFPDSREIDFIRWIEFNSVPVLITATATFFSLQIMLMGLFRRHSIEAKFVRQGNLKKDEMHETIKTKLEELGPISYHEISVFIMFCLCVALWITTKPYICPGWADLYPLVFHNDDVRTTPVSTSALICFLILTLPASCSFWKFCSRDKSQRPAQITAPLLPWGIFQQRMSWGLIFMIGGGVSLAQSSITSGLATYLGKQFATLQVLPPNLIMVLTSGTASILTEFITNAACCNILTPIYLEMSVQMKVHPLLFTYPAAICSAFGFMLPCGTPVNAIMVDQAHIRNADMMRYGFTIKVIALTVIFILFPTYGAYVYECYGYPDWAKNLTTDAMADYN